MTGLEIHNLESPSIFETKDDGGLDNVIVGSGYGMSLVSPINITRFVNDLEK